MSISSGQTLNKNCESLYWWDTFHLSSNVYIRRGLNPRKPCFQAWSTNATSNLACGQASFGRGGEEEERGGTKPSERKYSLAAELSGRLVHRLPVTRMSY